MKRSVALFVLILVGFGCSSAKEEASPAAPEQTTAAPDAPAEAVVPEKTPAEVLMKDHFVKALEVHQALIRADVSAATEGMAALAGQTHSSPLPGDLGKMLEDMRATAGSAEQAKTFREAGEAFAGTVARCGVCHSKTGKGPEIARTARPEGEGAVVHMRLHHWATEEMWSALITADEVRFRDAAEALTGEPLDAKALGTKEVSGVDVSRLDVHVHKLAQEGLEATDLRTRAGTYARILATCGTCHKLMKQGPQPEKDVQPIP